VKSLTKIVSAVYLFTLLWLVLFKLSYDIPAVLNHQSRSLNAVPFADFSRSLRGAIDNLIIFIPLGMLLSVNFKQASFWHKLAIVFTLSFAVEMLQFVFAIGVTDTTDVIANTLGGLAGLTLYELGHRYVSSKRLDLCIVAAGALLLTALLLFRILVLRVRY
jgi:glycopeptide antibiotics resistance protein